MSFSELQPLNPIPTLTLPLKGRGVKSNAKTKPDNAEIYCFPVGAYGIRPAGIVTMFAITTERRANAVRPYN